MKSNVKTVNVLKHSFVPGLFFFNIIKISLFGLYISDSLTPWMLVYKGVLTAATCALLYYIPWRLANRWLWGAIYGIQTLYIASSLCYFGYYYSHLHLLHIKELFPEGASMVRHFIIPFVPSMLIAIIDLPLFVVFMVVFKRLKPGPVAVNKRLRRNLLLVLPAVVLMASEIVSLGSGTNLRACTQDYPKSENQVVAKYGTVINSVIGVAYNRNDDALIRQLRYGPEISGTQTGQERPNIVVIQVESLDATAVNASYNGNDVMPYLKRFSQQHIYYRHTLAYHLAGGTSDAEFSIINGIEPLTSYPSLKVESYDFNNSVAKRLKAGGYSVNAYHGNTGSFYNRLSAFDKMGFTNFYDLHAMDLPTPTWGAPDRDVFDFALSNLSTQTKPFFSYIITMTSHTPFTYVPDTDKTTDFDDIPNESMRNYFTSMRYTDQCIGDYVQQARQQHPNTYIFIVGDHASRVSGDDYENQLILDGNNMYDFVPLILITPDGRQGGSSSTAAGFLDIAPTILDISGVTYSYKSLGESLANGQAPSGPLPYKGEPKNRRELVNKIQQTMNTD